MTERLAAYAHERSLHSDLGTTPPPDDKEAPIERPARRHSFPVGRDDRKRLFVGQDPYPGQTKALVMLFDQFGKDIGVRAYADLSAVAHSTLPAFAVRRSPITSTNPLGLATASNRPSQPVPIERAVVIALAAYDLAIEAFLSSYGWSTRSWVAFVREAHTKLRRLIGVPPSLIDLVRVRES
jgi:hypothetical protein